MLAGILTGEAMDAITRNILQENHCIFLLLHTFWEVRAPPTGSPVCLPAPAAASGLLQDAGVCPLTLAFCVQVATPVQAARADHLCFPLLPDVLAMCAALSDDVTEESLGRKKAKVDPVTLQEAGESPQNWGSFR